MLEKLTENRVHPSNRNQRHDLIALLILLFTVAVTADPAQAQSTAFMYQGRLTETGAAANGVYDLQFTLYNAVGGQVGQVLAREDVQVSDGMFTVPLDFGHSPFTSGTAFTLEIGVRPGASVGAFTALAPRQPLSSSPYAIQTINAAQLGGVPADQYVKTDDPRLNGSGGGQPAPGSNNYIQNQQAAAQAADMNIAGNGVFGSSVGIGTSPVAGIRLQIDGNTQMITGAGTAGNRFRINLGSPNSETGMTLIKPETGTATGRADLRFDGSLLKLVASNGGIPAPTNGIAINTAGNVGIGTTSPSSKLAIVGNSGGQALTVQGSSSNTVMSVQNTDQNSGAALRVGGAGAGIEAGGIGVGVSGSSPNGVGVNAFSGTGDAIRAGSNTGYAARFTGRVVLDNGLPTGGTQQLCLSNQNIVSSCNSSSLRYKTDLHPFSIGLNLINRLHPISYKWKADGTRDLGFGAEDVATVEPLLTFRNNKGEIEGVRYDRLSVLFVNAFKEQQKEIEQLRAQLRQLRRTSRARKAR